MFDSLRTRLRDVIFGRTVIRVVSCDNAGDVTPIFVVGTFRSGTTLLRYLLDTHSRICCPPESKFLLHLAQMRDKESTRSALDSMGLEEGYIRQNLRNLASAFFQPYMVAKGKHLLVDKTPDYVRVLEFIDWLYEGQAQYIMIFRNGLDVAHSMTSTPIEPLESNKTPYTAFEYWRKDTEIMIEWMQRKKESCHKVVYESLCEDVSGVMSGVLNFIGEEWEDGIMEWYLEAHDRGHEDIKARRQRSIVKSTGNYNHWDEVTIARLKESAQNLHRVIGYDPDTLNLHP